MRFEDKNIRYIDTDSVFVDKFESIITNGYERVYGRVTNEIEVNILMSDLLNKCGGEIPKLFRSGLIYRLVNSCPRIEDKVLVAIFWNENHTQIMGYIDN